MLKLKKEHRYFELHSDCISLDLLPHLSKIADKYMSKKYFAKWNWYLLQMINCLDIFLTTINPAIKQQRWNGKCFISLIKRKTNMDWLWKSYSRRRNFCWLWFQLSHFGQKRSVNQISRLPLFPTYDAREWQFVK